MSVGRVVVKYEIVIVLGQLKMFWVPMMRSSILRFNRIEALAVYSYFFFHHSSFMGSVSRMILKNTLF